MWHCKPEWLAEWHLGFILKSGTAKKNAFRKRHIFINFSVWIGNEWMPNDRNIITQPMRLLEFFSSSICIARLWIGHRQCVSGAYSSHYHSFYTNVSKCVHFRFGCGPLFNFVSPCLMCVSAFFHLPLFSFGSLREKKIACYRFRGGYERILCVAAARCVMVMAHKRTCCQ